MCKGCVTYSVHHCLRGIFGGLFGHLHFLSLARRCWHDVISGVFILAVVAHRGPQDMGVQLGIVTIPNRNLESIDESNDKWRQFRPPVVPTVGSGDNLRYSIKMAQGHSRC